MIRKDGWETALAEYLRSRASRPFAWGENDCVCFAAGAIEAMTGVQPLPVEPGSYATETGAARAIVQMGGVSLESVVEQAAARMGMEEVPVLFARRGDVVLLAQDAGQSVGILGLDGMSVIAAGPEGAVQVPLAACRRAWRVG